MIRVNLLKNNCCKIFLAKDIDHNIHSGIFLVWTKKTVYYLIGGSNPEYRNSESMSLLMWESIKFASSFVDEFDFEGTMVESIERFIRGFGAAQSPYFQLTKVSPKFLKPLYEDVNDYDFYLSSIKMKLTLATLCDGI